MSRYIFLAVLLFGFGITAPNLIQNVLDDEKSEPAAEKAKSTRQKTPKTRKTSYNPLSGRTARARMNRNGHFYFNSKMNGVSVKVMVDTGATGVAINRSTARRLGIKLTNADFKYKSNTANGITTYAFAIIDEIQIGRVIINDVRAAVLKDTSLSSTLLGMSFLRRLRKFEINRETLILTQ